MSYNIRWINEEGGGRIAEGFATVEAAQEWWKKNGKPEEYDKDDTIAIYEEDGDTYGEQVEVLQ